MSDSRIDENRMLMFVNILNDDGDEEEISLPITFEVCGRCNGIGKHVNPNIDGHGITSDEWEHDWSYEEQDQYMSGGYDVSCEECHGKRVIPVVDEEKADATALKQYYDEQSDLADMYAEEAAERKFGC